jgi:hypothetical protein
MGLPASSSGYRPFEIAGREISHIDLVSSGFIGGICHPTRWSGGFAREGCAIQAVRTGCKRSWGLLRAAAHVSNENAQMVPLRPRREVGNETAVSRPIRQEFRAWTLQHRGRISGIQGLALDNLVRFATRWFVHIVFGKQNRGAIRRPDRTMHSCAWITGQKRRGSPAQVHRPDGAAARRLLVRNGQAFFVGRKVP